jgi:hypothetical protein
LLPSSLLLRVCGKVCVWWSIYLSFSTQCAHIHAVAHYNTCVITTIKHIHSHNESHLPQQALNTRHARITLTPQLHHASRTQCNTQTQHATQHADATRRRNTQTQHADATRRRNTQTQHADATRRRNTQTQSNIKRNTQSNTTCKHSTHCIKHQVTQ